MMVSDGSLAALHQWQLTIQMTPTCGDANTSPPYLCATTFSPVRLLVVDFVQQRSQI